MEKEEELSANSKMEGPRGPPRRPGGGQNTHTPFIANRVFFGTSKAHVSGKKSQYSLVVPMLEL